MAEQRLTARALVEEAGPEALTTRSLADRLGIKAPSLYKHFSDKAAVELIAQHLAALADAYRARAVWAFAHGMVILEIHGRFPGGVGLGEAWETGVRAFAP
ncbi:TetR/AcrR family transcriptional regulator [Streptomyces spectabilis]|uniref:AcrR family transcriptional regulator n=1 Tax=Streptomyces spectabilis TaxID=68270 RepID=A0A7W8ET19_STRST|nr:TetR-like C-terminal domain-containing protein [Streptomyces spectabilis]MBB5103046.1 AcrR family transcriptional regulator [Streptomyces spectabilis]MCI3902241.1 TetR family transcriptional regulator [Streptomyces spectabilis]GGV15098.1 hypothetical protein GCM10010245_26180 [Streptomyces spectabilis]